MSEQKRKARYKPVTVRWQGNDAKIECRLHDEPPTDYANDLLELIISPGHGNGDTHEFYMDLNDAWAIVHVIASCAFELQLREALLEASR